MLILHRPFWYDEPGKPAKPRASEPEHVRRSIAGPLRNTLQFGSGVGYTLKRGRSEHVRVMPQEQEAEYRAILEQLATLRQRLADVVEEGWVRAEPYRPEDSK